MTTTRARGTEPSRILPFTKGIKWQTLREIPFDCVCIRAFRHGFHELKFVNNFCRYHGDIPVA